MGDRRFTEIDLRRMLQQATGYREDVVEGRWVIETRHRGKAWEVIVEPDRERRFLVVVTPDPGWGWGERKKPTWRARFGAVVPSRPTPTFPGGPAPKAIARRGGRPAWRSIL